MSINNSSKNNFMNDYNNNYDVINNKEFEFYAG